ncbi:hypothetical protein HII31_13197 [Pseudocercospora fuligena]|uniref:Uncharacterized protein n=1 Tax=Pseudocercospora fuligena TaxID=685502 RepID=A0A8H6R6I9_9PEZI|nr:hypothetical protein HII31_13197 [Pseudocercospora fuligena]
MPDDIAIEITSARDLQSGMNRLRPSFPGLSSQGASIIGEATVLAPATPGTALQAIPPQVRYMIHQSCPIDFWVPVPQQSGLTRPKQTP